MVLAKPDKLLSRLPGGDCMHTFLIAMSVAKQQRFAALLRQRVYQPCEQVSGKEGSLHLRSRGFDYDAVEGAILNSVSLYCFTDLVQYEIAPLWWVRCFLCSRTLEHFAPNSVKFGDNEL
jgi:hypothetical protein